MAGLLVPVSLVVHFIPSRPARGNPDALWHIVHESCVPAAPAGGAPCRLVDLDRHYAVLKDRRGATQFLVIPTDRVTGIESPLVLAPDAPNYWQAAWEARRFVAELATRPIPRGDVALAVNSAYGRSQNQLHIHVDCVRPDVAEALDRPSLKLGAEWTPIDQPLAGHHYRARRIDSADFSTVNPFRLLAGSLPPGAHMADETLVAVGRHFADGTDGFVLLQDRANRVEGDFGSGESLLDHDCAILHEPS